MFNAAIEIDSLLVRTYVRLAVGHQEEEEWERAEKLNESFPPSMVLLRRPISKKETCRVSEASMEKLRDGSGGP